ncbi:zinc ABC transporter substrate-binding protein ZnuA [Aliagarivorans taiwanensis]|uniref:zinc ABC transporter substrate-binding protein ZnuA n=1 Tax=Aliagarivorans taiwanensis TaxID=561966 RepID=UPI0003F9746A|nr:zinc ABC transporter substrate-binding protein ZnuA [Aliagarivorans taiwanensis]
MIKRLFTCFLVAFACQSSAEPVILTSIKPLQLLVTSLYQEQVSTDYLVDPRFSPHDYALRPSDIRKLRRADLIIWVGEELEPYLGKPLDHFPTPQLEVMALSDITLRAAAQQYDDGHNHELDPHVWLDIEIMQRLAERLTEKVIQLEPENAELRRAQLAEFSDRLATTEQRLQQQLSPHQEKGYFVFHDAYGYFESHFGMNRLGEFTINPQQRPGARTLSRIRQQLSQQQAHCIFAEPQFDGAILRGVSEETGAQIGMLDPMGLAIEANADGYFAFLEAMADDYLACLALN